MKNHVKNLFLLPLLTAGFGLSLAGPMKAQTFTTLHSFAALSSGLYTNSDGADPDGRIDFIGQHSLWNGD